MPIMIIEFKINGSNRLEERLKREKNQSQSFGVNSMIPIGIKEPYYSEASQQIQDPSETHGVTFISFSSFFSQ
jgi:hypothetical protein